jgi:CRP/FNR family transcriptional regulator, cyclic AMP receptor protein
MILERRDVLPFLERNPAACLKLMEMLCARIRRSDERMYDIAFLDLRLAKTLLHCVRQGEGRMKLSLSQQIPTAGWWEALWPDPAGVLARVDLKPSV